MTDYIKKCGNHLKKSVHQFLDLAVENPVIEHAWLSSLSEIEMQAGDQILKNITRNTPDEFVDEIRGHAADEYRHAAYFKEVQFKISEQDQRDHRLEKLFSEIIKSYVTGYFGNPELVKLRSRHAAYVHGAITIEQFPFQTYGAYCEKTKYDLIKQTLPDIVKDEHEHIELGMTMLKSLEDENRRSLAKLHRIEKQMTKLLMERFYSLSKIYLESNEEGREELFNQAKNTTWIYCLSKQSSLDEFKGLVGKRSEGVFQAYTELLNENEKTLQRSVLLDLRQEVKDSAAKTKTLTSLYKKYICNFLKDSSALDLTEGIRERLSLVILRKSYVKYLKKCIFDSNDIGVSFAMWLTTVQEEEHLALLQVELLNGGVSESIFNELSKKEDVLHNLLLSEVSETIQKNKKVYGIILHEPRV